MRVTRNIQWSTTVMPGNERVEVGGDEVLEEDEPLAVGQGDEAGQRRRHLDPGEALLVVLGVVHEDGQVERQVGDVGEGVGGVHAERGEDGEDPLVEDLVEVLAVVEVEVGPAAQDDAVGSDGRESGVDVAGPPAGGPGTSTRSPISSSCCPGVRPSGDSCVSPAATWSLSAATRTWKNSSRLDEKMAQNFSRSRRGVVSSAASASTRSLKSSQESSRLSSRGGGPSSGIHQGRHGLQRSAGEGPQPRAPLRHASDLLALGQAQIPVQHDALALGVAHDALPVAAELRVVARAGGRGGPRPGP